MINDKNTVNMNRYRFRIQQKNNPWFYDSCDAETLGDAEIMIRGKYPDNDCFEACTKMTRLDPPAKQTRPEYTREEIALIEKNWERHQEKLRGGLLDRTRESTYRLEIMASHRLAP